MKLEKNAFEWAENVFGECELGDERRTRRLVQLAALAADKPGESIAAACCGDLAAQEGAYRLMRNKGFPTTDIDDGAFMAAANAGRGRPLLLAIQDTTGVSFTHETAQEFAEYGCPTGFFAHTTLLVDAESKAVLGVVDQERWMRKPQAERPDKEARKQRAYKDKESFRWEQASRRVHGRLDDASNVMDVGDREADIFEYLHYLQETKRRFTIRSRNDRELLQTPTGQRLWSTLEAQPLLGLRTIVVEQRGGQTKSVSQNARAARSRREVVLEIRAAQVTIRPPPQKAAGFADITLHAVLVTERNPPKKGEPLEWMLLTSEPVDTLEETDLVVGYYECRWLIEGYFKALKSGCQLEHRPLQTRDRLERMIAIISHVAVRIAQMHWQANEADDETPCTQHLTQDEYSCLWASTERGKKRPKRTPSAGWAYRAMARLAGWTDTKHTGRIGWRTIWRGWDTFQQRMVGWNLAIAAGSPTARAEM